jgi:hypothetical protein
MLKSKSVNTNKRHKSRWALALMAGSMIAGCGDGKDPWTIDPDGYDGLGQKLLTTGWFRLAA